MICMEKQEEKSNLAWGRCLLLLLVCHEDGGPRWSCWLSTAATGEEMHDLRGKARREEATWPVGGACCYCWSVVRMVVHGEAASDPLQAEKQR
ncbi:hypothetical protein POTOM_011295 [Populus tomentosa]|uniref:Uncharacterized protein n=1 Tax=Populus tomentosa TaxID=118781 RepID=A0A8X8D8K6_POPTO|nr:hypothetical protein POTOM_011295 [Populus tomentosa]